ncbi:Glutamyl-tRNA(Gln) synthetase [hydrothermal vent metagenome]|uniref:Glutamyl-tRNA(Gln) synthetase n=1 Tax=hydrothermal vent metagenome TaxID=652676 RepID=A0A1W1BR23_9ZZZZ
MLRFAFVPSGDMNLNELRLALVNFIVSQQRNEDFLVRIDDIDKNKTVEKKDQESVGILDLFGIKYSQVVHQSQNIRFHSAMALQLLHEKKAFSCFCSDEWLQKKQEEAKAANKPYRYDDACRNLPAELVIDNTAPFSVRIVRPDNTSDDIDSFVILHRDKTPTHTFATAVDDMLSDISLVVRREDELRETQKEVHIRNSLGYAKTIEYVYLPDMKNADNIAVKALLEEGYLPEAILNYLISTVVTPQNELFTLQEAIEWFSLENIITSPASFDMQKLKEINQKHLKKMDARELSRFVGFADAEIGKLAKLYADKLYTTKELKSKIEPIFQEREIPSAHKEPAALIQKALKDAPHFAEYETFKSYMLEKTGLQEEDFTDTFRILLTASEDDSDIAAIYACLKNYIEEIIK